MYTKKPEHRIGSTTIKLERDGKPLAHTEALVRQRKHEFLFGCSEFETLAYVGGELDAGRTEIADRRYKNMFDIFNSVTLPFYWGRYEPEEGNTNVRRMTNAANWLRENDCAMKGHTLCWHTVCADWLMKMSDGEIMETLLKRINREVAGFKGLIDTWDVINEAVIMPLFDRYDNAITRVCRLLGRARLVREVFAEARHANPDATLLINDFNTSEEYALLIEGLLECGVQIDAIGIQSHMHQGYWGAEKTHRVLERFARFGLPLHFTENSLVSGRIMPAEIEDLNDYQPESWPSTPDGEERQAAEVVSHYELLYAHPLVKSITWWSFSDGLWLGAPSGLVTREGYAKPAYTALHGLIKGAWWTPEQRCVSNEAGEITVTGTKGLYEAEAEGQAFSFKI